MAYSIIAPNFNKYFRQSAKRLKLRRILLFVSGFAIGIVNGLFGSGGGMLVVPVLTYIACLDEKHSHATAIAVILPLCAISTIVYAIKGGYQYEVFAPTIIGVVFGGIIGAVALKKISNDILPFVFYGFMLFAGIKMLL